MGRIVCQICRKNTSVSHFTASFFVAVFSVRDEARQGKARVMSHLEDSPRVFGVFIAAVVISCLET